MRRAMLCGSFDPLHDGHRSLFAQAKRHGDFLIVVVARDSSIRRIKKHEPRQPEAERLAAVQAEPLVDAATLGDEQDFWKPVELLQPDVLVLGYDQVTFDEDEIRRKLKRLGLECQVVRAKPHQPEKYKSSLISGRQA